MWHAVFYVKEYRLPNHYSVSGICFSLGHRVQESGNQASSYMYLSNLSEAECLLFTFNQN